MKIEIKNFRDFALNEVKAEVQKVNNSKVTKEFEAQLKQLVEVFDKIEDLEAQIKHLKTTSKGLEDWITGEMENKYGATLIKVGKIIVALKEQRGRVVPSYKGMVDAMSNEIRKLVKDMSVAAGIINEIKEKHTPDAKTSKELHFAVEESISTWGKKQLTDLKAWLKSQFTKLSKAFSSADKSANKLMKMLDLKITESYEFPEDTDNIAVEHAKAIIIKALENHRDEHGSNMAYDIDIEHAMIEIFEDDHEIAQQHAPMIVEALKEICEKISKAAKKINATKYGSGPGGTPEKPTEGQNEEI